MARSMFYSILFLDSHNNHISLRNTIGMVFFDSIDKLFESFWSPTEVKFCVCICCPEKSGVLDKLETCSNVASVSICKDHHRDAAGQNYVPSHSKLKREIVFDECLFWQIEVHIEAFHANAAIQQSLVTESIKRTMDNLIEQNYFKPHSSGEENQSSNSPQDENEIPTSVDAE
jgi:hypothetical protein